MLLSTAIPIVIAAIVIVIISKGIFNNPIIPNMKNAAIKLGTTPIKDNLIFLNKIINIENIPIITKPKVKICDLNKLCSKLLNRIKNYCPPDKVKIIPAVNLRVLAGVLKKSRMFIGNDSGMMHLAAMVGTPIVAIFGPGNFGTTGPYMAPENCEILTENYSCSPCRQRFFKECKPSPHNKPYCLEDITVKNVYEAIHRLSKRI